MQSPAEVRANGVRNRVRVDVQLVLAVDVSGSISPAELGLQRKGYAQALRSPQLLGAIASGASGVISITYVEWSGPGNQFVAIPWREIRKPEDAAQFASELDNLPVNHSTGSGSTSISSLLLFCSKLFGTDQSAYATRRVIDISGDGPNNTGPPMLAARNAVLAKGITINGLAIDLSLRDEGNELGGSLRTYFETCVIGGSGAFAVGVSDIEDLRRAILQKMMGEVIAGEPVLIPASAAEGPLSVLDCSIPGQQPGR